jgi:tetratricopeptide (TPR) repeat protein
MRVSPTALKSRRTALLGVALALALAPSAHADPLPAAGWKTLRVGVLPVHFYGRGAEDLFAERPDVRRVKELAGGWNRRLEATLAERDQIDVMRTPQLRERLSRGADFRRTVAVAQERFDLGVLRYHDIQPDDALTHFQRARELYTAVFADVAIPESVAEAAFYQGVILAEQGEPTRAHMAFRDALTLDPDRRVARGYYPRAVEQSLIGAQADIAIQRNVVANRFTPERLDGLARVLGLDALILAFVEGEPEAPSLRLLIYDQRTRGLAASDHIPLDDDAAALDRLDRTLAAWHACAVESENPGIFAVPRRPRWFLDIGYSHGVWLEHKRTRDYLQGVGGQLTVTWEPMGALQVFVRASQLVTLSDAKTDLLDEFVTSRITLGAGLVIGSRRLRAFARMGVDLGLSLSDIDMTTDVDCKHFGLDHPRCGTFFTAKAPAVWFGLDSSLGARLELADGFYLAFTVGITSYVLDPDTARNLNFPLHGSLGFGAPL